jgi:hypothetical protein
MRELIIFLCFMNPCITIPDEQILIVPNPWIVDFYTDPDDIPMHECQEEEGWRIKWVKPVIGA